MTRKLYIEFIFLFCLGGLTSLSLPPFNYLVINFLTLSLFFIFLIKKLEIVKLKKIFFFYGWFFGFGYFITNLYWISISLTFDENFKFLIPITFTLIPSFLALFYGLISFLFFNFKTKKIVVSFLLFSLFFGFLEFLRGFILTGFPWNLIAYSFSNHLEIISIISIIGTHGFNIFCISLFTVPALFILKPNIKYATICIFFLFITFLFYFYGSISKKKFDNTKINQLDYKIRLLGSNIKLDRFYSNYDPVKVIEDLIKISNPNKQEKTIFVWPEGILSGISQKELVNYYWLFEKTFNENHLLIVGINSQSDIKDKVKYFNSFSVYDHNLNLVSMYNKINLVPFGEFLPLENILRKAGFSTLTNNYQSYSKGIDRKIIELNKKNFSIRLLPLICYEIIYSGRIFNNSDFDFIVNISEDGWFGQSIGPKQHFIHSIYRAIESGKYVLRSSNNGISAIINPLGTVEQEVSFNETGFIDFNQFKKIQSTAFSKYGNRIFGLIILLYIFLIFSFNRINNE
ncbi:apolipoprotein N-acyltransferase [Candidatus Pelagibacter sp.]|nr:apolipoprotein N-acyltransferase [Candidatus Pelagibacter sp.]